MTIVDASILALGIVLLAGACWLWKHRAPEEVQQVTRRKERVTLAQLAVASWLKPAQEGPRQRTAGQMDVYALREYWREPSGRFASGYMPRWTHTHSGDFYNEYLANLEHLAKSPYVRGVILHLLEMLDQEHPVPSVSSPASSGWAGQKAPHSNAIGYDEHKYAALRSISLLEHTLNVAGFLIDELKRNRQEFLIPKAVVAALAHDLGKLPSIRMREEMRGLSHPMRSAKLLEEMEGFDRISARADILAAVENHHRTGHADYLVTLLRSVDHRMRDAEYVSVVKAEKSKQASHSWQEREGAGAEEEGRADLAEPLPTKLPESPDEITADTEDGLADEKYPKVLAWVNQTDLPEYSPDLIGKQFAVGRARAQVLYQTLVNQGHLKEGNKAETPEASPVTPNDLLATQEQIVFVNEPERGGEEARLRVVTGSVEVDCDYNPFALTNRGKMTSIVFETEPPVSSDSAQRCAGEDSTDGTEWFQVDEFLRQLRSRLNVDMVKARADGTQTGAYFHGVTTRSGLAYFRIQCIKELLADQVQRHPHLTGVKNIILCGDTQKEISDTRTKILKSVVQKLIDAGHVDASYFRAGGYSVVCAVITKGGQQNNQHFVPFFSEVFGSPKFLEERKQGQPIISQVVDIKPMAALKAQEQEAAHG